MLLLFWSLPPLFSKQANSNIVHVAWHPAFEMEIAEEVIIAYRLLIVLVIENSEQKPEVDFN